MRIGIFTDTYPPYINGVSTSVLMLQKALEKKGHQVFIVTVNPEGINYKYQDDKKIIRIPGVPIGIYDYRLTGIYPIRSINIIKKWDLDIIHSHTEFGVGTFARIIATQLDIPLVHTYHTMYEDYVHYITKGYFDGPSKKIVEYLTKFYCDKTTSELIVPTKKTYDLFKEKYKYDRNVHIIPTGIELDRFYPENIDKDQIENIKKELKISNNDFIILFVGRLGKEKNVDFLIECQKELVKKKSNCKLIIIGDGPDSDEFKDLVRKYKIEDKVIFTGKVPWEIVPIYYQLADVFATASLTETQGLTVIEAMASSKCVVAINDESFNGTIIDGLNGFLFNNKKEYQKIIEKLFFDKALLSKICNQAKISSEMHSSKYFGERVLDVYNNAIKNSDKKKRNIITKVRDIIKESIGGK
ncbi:MAG TPA: glycosyltransferase family 4 protein [Tenericutes bacterium]|nr:glycosyltransferase family 4 protein [Mycoplasmatota bacterium]